MSKRENIPHPWPSSTLYVLEMSYIESVACSLPSYESNQRWLIVKEKLITNFDKSFTFFIWRNVFPKLICDCQSYFSVAGDNDFIITMTITEQSSPGHEVGSVNVLKSCRQGQGYKQILVNSTIHSMGTLSALLNLCGVIHWGLCDVIPNELLNKHSIDRWSETLCRSYNITSMTAVCRIWINIWTVLITRP